ncbi:hypothetical protein [Prevotella sp. P6B1]|nr:hypothetical protein [Prevotella sp. P6B1]
MGGSLTMKNGRIDKYLFEGGYAQASVAEVPGDMVREVNPESCTQLDGSK